jgi:hypothetical protein
MSSKSLYDRRVQTGGKQHFRISSAIFKKDLVVEGTTYLEKIGMLGALRVQDITMLNNNYKATSSDYFDWTASSSNITVSIGSNGPTQATVGNNSTTGAVRAVVTTAATAVTNRDGMYGSIPTALQDWSKFKYLGFWYKGVANKGAAAADLTLDLFGYGNTSISALGGANQDNYKAITFPSIVTSEATPLWRYMILDISTMTETLAKKITRVAISVTGSATLADSFGIVIGPMELFSIGYIHSPSTAHIASGPARGLVQEAYVEPGSTAIANGQQIKWTSNGHVKPCAAKADAPMFAGVALEAADASATYTTPVKVKFVSDGVINRLLEATMAFAQTGNNPAVTIGASEFLYSVADATLAGSIRDSWQTIGVALAPSVGGLTVQAEVIPVYLRKSGYAGYNE